MSLPSNTPPAIPGYRLLEQIGEGGKGEVYRALEEAPGRVVAIKYLNAMPSPNLADDFRREADLMGSLTHPNVVAIYGCGEIKGRFYLVTEYVAGSTLRSRMKPDVAWPVAKVVPLLQSIAGALIFIHSRDVLHLDLKPENVLCDERDAIKITDFGLALSRVDAWTLSELGLVQASLDYCSPEQRYGLPIDQRSDLFSLATLAYELLTGHLPGRVFVPTTQRNPTLPPGVDEPLRRGLARDPDERYRDVDTFNRTLMLALQEG